MRYCRTIEMRHNKVIIWASIGFGAAVTGFFSRPHILHSQQSETRPAETRAVAQASEAAHASGTLEGMVTLACAHGAVDCIDRPYHVGLFLEGRQRGAAPIHVYASPRFSITLAPGSYTISSADIRGSCCLPMLEPVTVVVRPGSVTRVMVRFEPGLELPTREPPR